MSNKGILVSQTDVVNGTNIFDTRKDRLQVALNHNPPHHNITYVQGTALTTVNTGISQDLKETLFSTRHGLGYTPKCLVYIYVPSTGSYYVGTFIIGSGGFITDKITYEIDYLELRIVHELIDGAGIGYTSDATTLGKIQIKYSIFSNPINNYTNPTKR